MTWQTIMRNIKSMSYTTGSYAIGFKLKLAALDKLLSNALASDIKLAEKVLTSTYGKNWRDMDSQMLDKFRAAPYSCFKTMGVPEEGDKLIKSLSLPGNTEIISLGGTNTGSIHMLTSKDSPKMIDKEDGRIELTKTQIDTILGKLSKLTAKLEAEEIIEKNQDPEIVFSLDH